MLQVDGLNRKRGAIINLRDQAVAGEAETRSWLNGRSRGEGHGFGGFSEDSTRVFEAYHRQAEAADLAGSSQVSIDSCVYRHRDHIKSPIVHRNRSRVRRYPCLGAIQRIRFSMPLGGTARSLSGGGRIRRSRAHKCGPLDTPPIKRRPDASYAACRSCAGRRV
jgi:hypothetical protein